MKSTILILLTFLSILTATTANAQMTATGARKMKISLNPRNGFAYNNRKDSIYIFGFLRGGFLYQTVEQTDDKMAKSGLVYCTYNSATNTDLINATLQLNLSTKRDMKLKFTVFLKIFAKTGKGIVFSMTDKVVNPEQLKVSDPNDNEYHTLVFTSSTIHDSASFFFSALKDLADKNPFILYSVQVEEL